MYISFWFFVNLWFIVHARFWNFICNRDEILRILSRFQISKSWRLCARALARFKFNCKYFWHLYSFPEAKFQADWDYKRVNNIMNIKRILSSISVQCFYLFFPFAQLASYAGFLSYQLAERKMIVHLFTPLIKVAWSVS